ncbi:unnamed protein product [Cuscuta campestris]|uniref:Glycosyltransferase n=1 Tax=Cuscuta campestris TaxID=132261 RepID=A0A484MI95_9ASTE|nr:unnamed protein product [Cuscuta campestris]
MSEEGRSPSVLMFPFLAHGHITPYLGLAKNLSHRGFLIHLCSTPVILASVKNMIPERYSASIRPVELHLPHLPELPPHYHTTNGLPPHLQPTLRRALRLSKPSFSEIMRALKPDLLVLDFLQVWAEGVAHDLRIPTIRFYNVCAATSSYINFTTISGSEDAFPFPSIRLDGHWETVFRASVRHIMMSERGPEESLSKPQMVLISSSTEMEPEYIQYYSKIIGCKVIPIGLLAQDQTKESPQNTGEILDWLETKEEGSVMYISFGSECFLSKEEIEEMARGLELVVGAATSKVNFIWVLRTPNGKNMDVEESLPNGFVEKMGERGRIVKEWAPQVKILSHRSVGGFLTHCGWNSIMESLNFSVPIIAMPIHVDQPVNARFLVEKGLAIEVTRDGGGKFSRTAIARAVEEAFSGKRSEALKMRVKDMSIRLKMKQSEEMDNAAQELRKLCAQI